MEDLAANLVSKASLSGALPVNHLRKNDYFGYAQDEYKWRPNLTLNLGVRYTIFDLFHEENGLANPFDFATCGAQGFCGIGASFGQQNYGDVDPRIGFAWSPRKGGQTVIRGGFGIYHEDGQLDDQNLPAKNEVPSYMATSSAAAHRIRLIVLPAPEPSRRTPNNGTAKTPMLSSGASRCSASCLPTSWARCPTWEVTACICWKPTS